MSYPWLEGETGEDTRAVARWRERADLSLARSRARRATVQRRRDWTLAAGIAVWVLVWLLLALWLG